MRSEIYSCNTTSSLLILVGGAQAPVGAVAAHGGVADRPRSFVPRQKRIRRGRGYPTWRDGRESDGLLRVGRDDMGEHNPSHLFETSPAV